MADYRRTPGYQYETSPRKVSPEYEPKKHPYAKKKASTYQQNKEKKQPKKQMKPKVKAVLYVLIGFSILFAISYRNSMITEKFTQKESLKKQLSTLEKENAQIEISIQNSLNLNNVQNAASSKLGMKKLDDSQKVYVTLPKKDYVEPASEKVIVTEEKGWLQEFFEKILNQF